MNFFYLISTEKEMENFKILKKDLLRSHDLNIVKNLLRKMFFQIQDFSTIKILAEKNSHYIYSGPIDVEMAYEIAYDVLKHEIERETLKYPFALFNGIFYFYFLPPELKPLFFLNYGIRCSLNKPDLMKKSARLREKIVIYKENEDILETYAVSIKSENDALFPVYSTLTKANILYPNLEDEKKLLILQWENWD